MFEGENKSKTMWVIRTENSDVLLFSKAKFVFSQHVCLYIYPLFEKNALLHLTSQYCFPLLACLSKPLGEWVLKKIDWDISTIQSRRNLTRFYFEAIAFCNNFAAERCVLGLENDGYNANTIALVCQQVTFVSASISAKRFIRLKYDHVKVNCTLFVRNG